MGALLYRLARTRGLFGDSRVWLVVWSVMVAARLFRRVMGDNDLVYRERLQPGEVLVVRDGDRRVRVLGGGKT